MGAGSDVDNVSTTVPDVVSDFNLMRGIVLSLGLIRNGAGSVGSIIGSESYRPEASDGELRSE